MTRGLLRGALLLLIWMLTAGGSSAQTAVTAIDGPPAPIAPAVVNRDSQGRATARAIPLAQPLVFDGRLDDGVYGEVASISDFVQQVWLNFVIGNCLDLSFGEIDGCHENIARIRDALKNSIFQRTNSFIRSFRNRLIQVRR